MLCQWLQETSLGTALRESIWVFPIVETAHVLCLALSAGVVVFIDLRLIGVVMRDEAVAKIVKHLEPWAIAGFIVMMLTGALLFWSEPVKLYMSVYFRIKFLLLLLAGINVSFFHFKVTPGLATWSGNSVPSAARIVGWLSLTLWIGVIAAGRATAYNMK